jgi:hypothetical protein
MSTSDTDDIVYFLMPDGTKVSNDPRFDLQETLQEISDNTEYKGDAGIDFEDQTAQTQVLHPDPLNSGQPGVGENAVPDDVVRNLHGPMGSPAQQRQTEDMAKAKEAGATPDSTSVEDDEPVDSNEAVLQARAARQDRQRKAQEALEAAGEDAGDPDESYDKWSAKQLKLEVAKRNAEPDRADTYMLDLQKGMKKGDVVEMLDADDARKAGQVPS